MREWIKAKTCHRQKCSKVALQCLKCFNIDSFKAHQMLAWLLSPMVHVYPEKCQCHTYNMIVFVLSVYPLSIIPVTVLH